MGAAQMAIIAVIARRRNFPVGDTIPLRDFPGITVRAFPALMMPVVLLGFIYSGVTTPTEAAAIAAAYAFLISALLYREVTLSGTYASLLSSARTTASIGMLIAGAMVFNYVVTVENIPHSLSAPSCRAASSRRPAISSSSTCCSSSSAACSRARPSSSSSSPSSSRPPRRSASTWSTSASSSWSTSCSG